MHTVVSVKKPIRAGGAPPGWRWTAISVCAALTRPPAARGAGGPAARPRAARQSAARRRGRPRVLRAWGALARIPPRGAPASFDVVGPSRRPARTWEVNVLSSIEVFG